jgi:tetratricopeptide (TPR) repeat protein
MTRPVPDDREPATTSGTIAVANLHAQIDGLTARVLGAAPVPAAAQMLVEEALILIDLLTLRGHVLGRITDYERAAELAEQLVRGRPDSGPPGGGPSDGGPSDGGPSDGGPSDGGTAWLARARTQATFHRFAEALADLDAAERNGLDRPALEAERAAILQASGRHPQAADLHRSAAMRQPGFVTLAALAVFHAERADVAEAEHLFTEARRSYQGISPFPLASLDFRRGLMWYHEGDLPAARTWLGASQRRVPAYAPALGCLAEIDTSLGAYEAAIGRLRPLASSSDDPQYAAGLAAALTAAGQHQEAGQWRASAAARYDDLALRHPAAFAGHAADFRRDCGLIRGTAAGGVLSSSG